MTSAEQRTEEHRTGSSGRRSAKPRRTVGAVKYCAHHVPLVVLVREEGVGHPERHQNAGRPRRRTPALRAGAPEAWPWRPALASSLSRSDTDRVAGGSHGSPQGFRGVDRTRAQAPPVQGRLVGRRVHQGLHRGVQRRGERRVLREAQGDDVVALLLLVLRREQLEGLRLLLGRPGQLRGVGEDAVDPLGDQLGQRALDVAAGRRASTGSCPAASQSSEICGR